MTSSMAAVLLAALVLSVVAEEIVVHAEEEDAPPCPESCTCKSGHYTNDQTTFHVTCGADECIRKVPGWAELAVIKGNISISLHAECIHALHRKDFPAGLTIVSLEIVKKTQVNDPDVFHNMKDSLEEIKLKDFKVHLNDSIPFLSGLPKLRRLHIKNIPDHGRETVVTGSPFKDTGMSALLELSLVDNSIVDFGSDMFEGVAAEKIVLAGNNLRRFPTKALQKVKGLKLLNLKRNAIRKLQSGDTEGLKLENINLENNEIVDVEEGALSGVVDTLEVLSLKNNFLNDIPAKGLAPLKVLKELDMTDNRILEITSPLDGNYCLERLTLGGEIDDEERLHGISPDVFAAQGRCLKYLNLFETRLEEFPTAALQSLKDARHIYMEIEAVAELREGALSGVGTRKLSIRSPLEAIHRGAFENLTLLPLSLNLEGTLLPNISFFYEYPAGTFSDLHVISSELPCDCNLGGVRHNLRIHRVVRDGALIQGDLRGHCLLEGKSVDVKSADAQKVFSACSNYTVLEAPQVMDDREGSDDGQTLQGSRVAALVISMLLFLGLYH